MTPSSIRQSPREISSQKSPPISYRQPVQPFKEAMQKSNSPEMVVTLPVASFQAASVPPVKPPVTPISLSALSKDNSHVQVRNTPTNSQKIPTPKNVDDLKSALKAIMGKQKEKSGQDQTQNQKMEEKKKIVPPAEVPKDVLEGILKI